MDFIQVIILFLGGVVAASSYITKQSNGIGEHINKIKPFQGILGVALIASGLIILLSKLQLISFYFNFRPLWGLVIIFLILINFLLGFILGFQLIAKYMLKNNQKVVQKGKAIKNSLIQYQNTIGITGIILSILWLLIIFRIVSRFGF